MNSFPVMTVAFGLFVVRIPWLCWWCLRYLPADTPAGQCRRLLLLSAGLPLFLLLQLLHWIGFLFDEILFGEYRRIRVDRPVFIVGVPRSGTTLLQRTIANDSAFTTMSTWECLLAPSISERYVYRLLARPLRPLGSWLQQRKLADRLEAIHRIGLTEPEEDFLVLLPVLSCFLLIVVFPQASGIRRLAFFDEAVPVFERRIILEFYFRCMQRHLYFHGQGRRFLSKNPSFTPMLDSLKSRFNDACIIGCMRSPEQAVPSQLSALRPALSWFGTSSPGPSLCDFVLRMLHEYYRRLGLLGRQDVSNTFLIDMDDLQADLYRTVLQLYVWLDQPLATDMQSFYAGKGKQVRNYRSGHRYRLRDFGLDEERIRRRFADVWPIDCEAVV